MTKKEKRRRERLITREQNLRRRERLLAARLLETPSQTLLPESPPSQQKTRRSVPARVWGVIAGLSTLVGLVGLAALYPQMSAQTLEAADPTDALTAPVVVTNDSVYTFSDVRSFCIQVKGTGGGGEAEWIRFSRHGGGDSLGNMEPGQPATIMCDFVKGMLQEARATDFMVSLSFRPWLIPPAIPLRVEKSFRLVAVTDWQGHPRITLQPNLPIPCLGLGCK